MAGGGQRLYHSSCQDELANLADMITKRQYIEYLLNTPINYTCSNLAEHLEGCAMMRSAIFCNGDE